MGGAPRKNRGFKLRETPATQGASETPEPPSPSSEATPSLDIDQLGQLPQSYGSDTIFLIAQEPHWLFTYWDIDISRHPGGKTFLRVYQDEKTIEAEIEVPFETRNWYIPVKQAGSKYTVEIGYHRGSTWNAIARSYTIETPSDRLSESDQFNYATIPLHLSFQKLMERIQDAIKSGEPLLSALSRLQMEGSLFGPAQSPGVPLEQRLVLEALLGSNFLEEVATSGLSSKEIEEKVRKRLEERITSQGAISSFPKEQWSAAESSLFSALGAMSSGAVSSWSAGELSSWAAAVLSSWAAAGQSSAGWSGESLGSWSQAAQSSWGAAALSSWLKGAESSWAQAAISSWLQGAEAAAGRRRPSPVGCREPRAAGRRRPSPVGCREPRAAGRRRPSPVGCREPKAAGRRRPFPAGHQPQLRVGRRRRSRAGLEPLNGSVRLALRAVSSCMSMRRSSSMEEPIRAPK